MLRCMVKLEVKKGRLWVKKVSICKGQNLISQTGEQLPTKAVKKKNKHRKKKEIVKDVNLSQNDQSDLAAIMEDVKKLIEAREGGQTNNQLKDEIKRLHQIVIDGQLQDVVVEAVGKEGLRKLFTMARSIRRREKKKEDKQCLSGKSDSEEKKLDNKLRKKWLRWFVGMYGLNGKHDMEKQMYKAIQKSAYYLNFVELQNECSTDAQFYQNGLACCYKIAINLKIYKPAPKRRKKTQSSNTITGSPHITRKDWGSPFRPARG